jgi:hypothetical protein
MAEKSTTRSFGPLATLLGRRRHDVGPRPFQAEWLDQGPRLDLRVETDMDIAIERPFASRILTPPRLLVAAALTLVLAVPALWLLLGPRAPANGQVGLSAVVLFTVGNVTAEGRELSAGDIVPAGAVVKVEHSSLCDLQVRETRGGIVIRLFPESEYRLSGHKLAGVLGVRSNLPRGRARFNVGKLPSNEEVSVVTPTAVANVRGTGYEVTAGAEETRVTVDEGSVAARASLSEISELPIEIVSGSRVLRAVESVLGEFETVLGPGETIVIRRRIAERVLTAVPAFQEKLSDPVISAHRGAAQVDDVESKAAIDFIDRAYPDEKSRSELLAAIRRALQAQDSRKELMPAGELEQRLAEYDELIAVDQATLQDSEEAQKVIRARNQTRREGLMREIERVMNKSAETLILKDGRRLRGVIVTEQGTYILLTPEGRESYAAERVEGVDF